MNRCIYGYKPNEDFVIECKTHCVLKRMVINDEDCQTCEDRSENKSSEWQLVQENVYDGLLIKEIKCPYCGYKQTFHKKPKELICYVCGNYSEYKETDND